MRWFKNKAQRGDTIIEVLVAATVLSLVLAVSYVSANRSLGTGTQAANRKHAVQYAEQQIELIRTAAINNSNQFATYKSQASAFCINPNDGSVQLPSAGGQCYLDSPDDIYAGAITYTPGNQTFIVAVRWLGQRSDASFSDSNTLENVTLYYQDPQ